MKIHYAIYDNIMLANLKKENYFIKFIIEYENNYIVINCGMNRSFYENSLENGKLLFGLLTRIPQKSLLLQYRRNLISATFEGKA